MRTYVGDVGSLILSEFFVVAQEEDGVLQGQSVVEVALGLALRCALHLQQAGSECVSMDRFSYKGACFLSLLPLLVSPSPAQPGSCPGSHQTASPPRTWSRRGSSGSDRHTQEPGCEVYSMLLPGNKLRGSGLDAHRRQVAHHEESREGGVEEEGDPLGGCGRDAEAAHAACVCCTDGTRRRFRERAAQLSADMLTSISNHGC